MKVLTARALKSEKGIPYCPDHIRRMARAGQFPQPIQLGNGRVAWIEEEIDDWIASRAAARTEKAV